MKILFLTENFPPERNAAASRVYERSCYWVKWGHEVTVLTSAPNFPEGKVFDGYRNCWYHVEILDGIRVVRVKTFVARNEGIVLRTLDFLSFMLSASLAGLFQDRPHVVVATSPQFFTAVAGWAVAAWRGIPFVFELGDLWPASISAIGAVRQCGILRVLERLELFLYRRSAKVVALTPSFKDDLVKRGIPEDKVTVVINGVDLMRFAPQLPDAELAKELNLEGCFVVGYLGTLGMSHALHSVLDAADLLRDRLPHVRFLFVGAGAAREFLVRATAERSLPNVVFVPSQPKDRIRRYWSVCDLALVHLKNVPLFSTVIPSKLFEAMAMGVATLVAAPEGEATRIVRDTGAGLIVPAEDPPALAEAVQRLCLNPEQVRVLSARALTAAPAYSREKQARAMIEALATLLA